MTTPHMIRLMSCASLLALGAGCSKSDNVEETAPPEPAATQGSESASEAKEVSNLETQRMNKSSRELSTAKSMEEKQLENQEQKQPMAEQPVAEQPAARPTAPVDEKLSDSEIVRVTDVVNNGEVEQGQLAKTKAENPKVKRFAERMITDHRTADQTDAKLVKREGIIPEESAASTEIANQGAATLEALRSTEAGPEFDRLYIERQVAQHEKVLDLLDQQLIPSAANAKVDGELKKTRGMAARHLTQALEIEQSLVETK